MCRRFTRLRSNVTRACSGSATRSSACSSIGDLVPSARRRSAGVSASGNCGALRREGGADNSSSLGVCRAVPGGVSLGHHLSDRPDGLGPWGGWLPQLGGGGGGEGGHAV